MPGLPRALEFGAVSRLQSRARSATPKMNADFEIMPETTSTLMLLLIRSPKFSRDLGFYGFAAEQNGFTYTLIPTLTLTITPTLSINLIDDVNSSQLGEAQWRISPI